MKPIIKADSVVYPTLQVPDLDVQEQFLVHFGMHLVEKTDDTLYMRGEGPQPFIHVTKRGEQKFVGSAYAALSMEDLEKISQSDSFGDIEEMTSPGGGFRTSAVDPNGIGVDVVFGIEPRETESDLMPIEFNVGGIADENFRRINQTKRLIRG